MSSQTEENYLKALFNLADVNGQVNLSELSAKMEVSMPSVNSMVKKLDSNGLVVYEKYRPLTLTAQGKKKAALIIRKHRLTEMYLVEKMGFGWEDIHEIAEQVEHVQSEAFFDRMDELLGYPKFDPHGSPIPDKHGKMTHLELRDLSKAVVGEILIIRALADSETGLLNFLNSKKLTIGTQIKVISKEVYDGSITITYGHGEKETLSTLISEKLLVDLDR